MRHSVAPFAIAAASSDGDILLRPRRRAGCTSLTSALHEWREEWRSGKASDDNPPWRVDFDSARNTVESRRAVRYLGALALHAAPFCAYVLLFGAVGPTYESAGTYAATKVASLILQLLGFLENTNFSLRNLPWIMAPGSILYSLVYIIDAHVTFSTGATGREARQRSEHGVGVSPLLAAVNAWAQVVAFNGDALWLTHTRVGWWCWCCSTAAASPPRSHRPPRSLVVRTLIFTFSVGVVAVFGLQFVRYDELVLRPLAASRPDLPWLRPLCCIAMRQLVGLAISLRIALYPIRSSKEQWLRVRGVVTAPFLLASVAGCATWTELHMLILQDALLFAFRVAGNLHLELRANPLRVSQQACRILAGRKGTFDVRTARVDALFAILAETVATTGMALGCMIGAATLLAVQGPLAPLPAYYLPLGAQSLLFLGLIALVECMQDVAVIALVARTTVLEPEEKRAVMERAYPPLPERAGAIVIAQASAAYIVYGFALYPTQTAFYARQLANQTSTMLSLVPK